MALDQWVWVWGKQRTLLYMQRGLAEDPHQPLEVWRAFGRLYLPKWDLDFIRRVLWKKLYFGGRMGHRVGSNLCSLCHKLEGTLDDFVARWVGVLEVWRVEKDLSLSRVDL